MPRTARYRDDWATGQQRSSRTGRHRMMALLVLGLLTFAFSAGAAAAGPADASRPIDFSREVRPILVELLLPMPRPRRKGPQGKAPPRHATRGHPGTLLRNRAIVPGKPEDSFDGRRADRGVACGLRRSRRSLAGRRPRPNRAGSWPCTRQPDRRSPPYRPVAPPLQRNRSARSPRRWMPSTPRRGRSSAMCS